MEAGLADHVWSLEELLGFLDRSNLAFGLTDLFRRVLKVKGFQKPTTSKSGKRLDSSGGGRRVWRDWLLQIGGTTIQFQRGGGGQIQYAILSRVLA